MVCGLHTESCGLIYVHRDHILRNIFVNLPVTKAHFHGNNGSINGSDYYEWIVTVC